MIGLIKFSDRIYFKFSEMRPAKLYCLAPDGSKFYLFNIYSVPICGCSFDYHPTTH